MNRFSDSASENALMGYISEHGFDKIPAAYIPTPDEITDERWQPIYAAAHALHGTSLGVTHISIAFSLMTPEMERRLTELFPLGWRDWHTHTDKTLNFNPAGIAEACKTIRVLAAKRKSTRIGQQVLDGDIEPAEAAEILKGIADTHHSSSLLGMLAARQFDPKNPPPKARPVYEMARKVICTPGNLTAITGKSKSGKSAVVGAFIGASLGKDGDTLMIDSSNHEGRALVHFDTEQSPADHHLSVATGLFRVKAMDRPDWLKSYRIADIRTSQRVEMLECALEASAKQCGGIHSVILDGVADFLMDPNDAKEAFALVERLHGLAVKYDTPILNVLHINPGSENNKTRGHLGSQLERKAESNLVVEKGEDGVSTIYSTVSRHAHVTKSDGPRFKWDDARMMHVTVESERTERKAETSERLRFIADEVFGTGAMKYTAARDAIRKAAGVKDARAEGMFTEMRRAGIISKDPAGFWQIAQ